MNIFEPSHLKEKIDSVLNHLIGLEKQAFEADVDSWRGFITRDFGIEHWDWPQGVGLCSMEYLQKYDMHTDFDKFFKNWVETNKVAGLPSANVNTTAPFIMLLALGLRTNDEELLQMCTERAEFLMNELPKTREGGFQHTTTDIYDKNGIILNEEQLWADTFFMAVLFLAQAGKAFNNLAWMEEAIYQISLHLKYLQDKKSGLLYHGWSFDRNDNFGSIFWCRGNCWFTFGILLLLEALADVIAPSTERMILNAFRAQVDGLMKLQGETGLWHTVLTDSESYEETSGTAGFVAGIYHGMRKGILDETYLDGAEKALSAIIENIEDNGNVLNVSGGTGMGMDAEHYKNIIIASMPYGQALTAMALIEARAFYEN